MCSIVKGNGGAGIYCKRFFGRSESPKSRIRLTMLLPKQYMSTFDWVAIRGILA